MRLGSRSTRRRTPAAALAGLCAAAAWTTAAAQVQPVADVRELSLEDLAKVDVTSVSKKAEPIAGAPSSIYVITNGDVETAGVLSLPEALRLAPNLQVARRDALNHVATARGFNSVESSNKMLVLIDGRTVYSPLFSGVFWDVQNVMLEDLDRIEVISGPGGVLWGANAMNGVINVLSRNAHLTQGGLVHGALGDRERYVSARYGGRFGDTGAFRLYAMGFGREDTFRTGVDETFQGFQTGFRTDWGGLSNTFTLQGDLYSHTFSDEANPARGETDLRGGNVIGRWTHQFGANSSLQLQAYFDKAERSTPVFFSSIDTYDVQVQHTWRLGRHEVVSGAGYRGTHDEFTAPGSFSTDPPTRWVSLSHVFVQDKITLRDDLSLIAGVKLEHSSYAGAELMPNVRLAWRPSDKALLWAAVSRAVRTPSRLERDLVFGDLVIPGTFESETLIAYEAGYRGQPLPRTTLSVSVFYNDYDDLRTTQPAGDQVFFGNGMTGQTYGVEAWGSYDVLPWWRLSAGFTALHKELELEPGVVDTAGMSAGGNDPSYQLMLRSQMEVTDRLSIDLRLRAVDDLPSPAVPAYVEADASIAYRLTDHVEISVSGRNLLDDHHPETAAPDLRRNARRSLYAGLRWTF